MKTKVSQAIIGGIVGTAAMTMVMFMAPLIGMPKMNPAGMLSMMMGFPLFIGWIMHFMIGIIFTLLYVFLLFPVLGKVNSTILKGVIFGFVAFIVAQIAIPLMGAVMGGMPKPQENMTLMLLGSIIGHIVFGVVAALFVKKQ